LKNSLWEQLISFSNLYDAFQLAARGRRNRASVASFEFQLEENLVILQQDLATGKYQPGEYTRFFIHDPKRRMISAAPFRDRVVHHALMNVIEPLFDPKFIYDTYANRRGKGTLMALDKCTYYLRCFNYVLPIDIVQYFPSISNRHLFQLLKNEIYDLHVLNLCKQILDSGKNPNSPLNEIGLPIGNLTSQFWANVYLNPLDHFIKRFLNCPGYVRYVDDMLLFSNSKETLKIWKEEIIYFLVNFELTIHVSCAQVRPCCFGVPFLGFQVFPDHRRLKYHKKVIARRRFTKMMESFRKGEISSDKVREKIIAWLNHASHGDTWRLRQSMLRNIVL